MIVLVKHPVKGHPIITTEHLTARWRRKHRWTGRRVGGMFNEVEDAGVDKSTLELSAGEGALNQTGQRTSSTWWARIHVKAERAPVAAMVRVMTAEDEREIAAKDAEIEAAKVALRNRREERADLVRQAFANGAPARWIDLIDQADAVEAARVAS